jgi:hypothetical protein
MKTLLAYRGMEGMLGLVEKEVLMSALHYCNKIAEIIIKNKDLLWFQVL